MDEARDCKCSPQDQISKASLGSKQDLDVDTSFGKTRSLFVSNFDEHDALETNYFLRP